MVRWLTDKVSDIFFTGDYRRSFDEIEDFLLTFSEFRLRHVSFMVSDIRSVGGGEDDGLKLVWS